MSVGENIRIARKLKKMTQQELADAIGRKNNVISDWENGKYKPDADMLELLCGALDVDANFLMDFPSEKKLFKNIQNKQIINFITKSGNEVTIASPNAPNGLSSDEILDIQQELPNYRKKSD